MRSSRIWMFVFTIILLAVPVVVLADPADIVSVDRTINPDEVAVGQAATVSLSMTGNSCQGTAAGADVALVIDRSWSMYPTCSDPSCPDPPENRIEPAVNAAKGFVDRLSTNDQGAVVAFAGSGSVPAQLGSSKTTLSERLNQLINDPGTDGTAIGNGIGAARIELQSSRHEPGNATAMIVLSDGENNQGSDPVAEASLACSAGIKVFTIGLGSEVDPSMEKITCNNGFYRTAPTPADLDQIYQEIASAVLGPIGTDATITEKVPAGLTVVSISDGGVQSGDTITWPLAQVENRQVVSYQVTANQIGTYTFDSGAGTYTNCALAANQPIDFPDKALQVVDNPPTPNPPEPIPEPATIALLGGGAAALAGYLRKRRGGSEEEQEEEQEDAIE